MSMTDEQKREFDALHAVWKELNESIRDGVRFRWAVTVTFMTLMVATAYYASARKGDLAWWVAIGTVLGCIAGIGCHHWWQQTNGTLLREWGRRSAALDAELVKRLPVGGQAPQPVEDAFGAERAGRVGIHVVAWATALAACLWVTFAWLNPTPPPAP